MNEMPNGGAGVSAPGPKFHGTPARLPGGDWGVSIWDQELASPGDSVFVQPRWSEGYPALVADLVKVDRKKQLVRVTGEERNNAGFGSDPEGPWAGDQQPTVKETTVERIDLAIERHLNSIKWLKAEREKAEAREAEGTYAEAEERARSAGEEEGS